MSGHDLLWEINWKEKKRKEKRSPEPDDPQEPQMCIHSLYLLLWKQPHSNMNTPPSLLLAAFSLSCFFPHCTSGLSISVVSFHQLWPAAGRQLSQVWQRWFKTCSLFQEKSHSLPNPDRIPAIPRQTALLWTKERPGSMFSAALARGLPHTPNCNHPFFSP